MQKTTTTITTKKAFRIITAAIIIAAVTTTVMLSWNYYQGKKKGLHSSSFKTEKGWGYDILVGDKIVVHQPMMPNKPGYQGFETEKAADSAAQEMLRKIRAREWP